MATSEPTLDDVYTQIIRRLRKLGIDNVADSIERTVARGVVLTEQESDVYQKSSVLRAMADDEKLAIALEFLVSTTEIPLMLAKVHATVGERPVMWLPERPGTEREEVSLEPLQKVDLSTLDPVFSLLARVVQIAEELNIHLPEVA